MSSAINSNLISGYEGIFNGAGITSIIPSGSSISTTVATGGFTLCGIYMPDAFTGSAITFLVAPETTAGSKIPSAFSEVYTSIGQTYGVYSLTATTSAYIAVNPDIFQGAAFIQIQSGSSEMSQRTLTLSLKGLS